MDVIAKEAHAEMIITVTRPDGTTQSAKFVSVNLPDELAKQGNSTIQTQGE